MGIDKLLSWRSDRRVRIVLIVLTVVATLVLATHPELRLLLPVLDSMGLDLLVLLVGTQFLAFVRPLAQLAWQAALGPLARAGYASAIYVLGTLGPWLDGALRARGLR